MNIAWGEGGAGGKRLSVVKMNNRRTVDEHLNKTSNTLKCHDSLDTARACALMRMHA